MIHVLFVCLGNICRSPMAEAVLRHLIAEAGLSDAISVDSVGTGGWHAGETAHRGTLDVLRRNAIAHDGRARQLVLRDLERASYVVAMDRENLAAIRQLDRHGRFADKLRLLLEFAPAGAPRDVPDPYYYDNFDEVYDLVLAGCRGLLGHLRAEHRL